jgi:beta-lactamase regulating signal transducer with metallopeptidase domain
LFWLTLLLTYGVHGCVWTGAAALLVRVPSLTSSARHELWRMALFGPVATAALAAALSLRFGVVFGGLLRVREVAIPTLAAFGSVGVSVASPRTVVPDRVLVAGAVMPAAVGLLRFAGATVRLWLRLRDRTVVQDERLLQRVERMRAKSGLRRVALSESAHLGSPVVVGIDEVCIPRASVAALDDAEVDGVLAHELAHLQRRDGIWFFLAGLSQSILWIQPLNRWVGSRFRQSAELACDDRAVELTRDPAALARALTRVAASALRAHRGALVPMMAASASALVSRVERLTGPTDGTALRRGGAVGRRLALVGLVAVGVATTQVHLEVAHADPSLLPDAAGVSQRMAELARREQQLWEQIDAAQMLPGAEQTGSANSVRLLELGQELRHVRSAEVWTEERFVEGWSTSQKRGTK